MIRELDYEPNASAPTEPLLRPAEDVPSSSNVRIVVGIETALVLAAVLAFLRVVLDQVVAGSQSQAVAWALVVGAVIALAFGNRRA